MKNLTDEEGVVLGALIRRAARGDETARDLLERAGGPAAIEDYETYQREAARREVAAARQRAEQAEASRRDQLRGVGRISDALSRSRGA